jgi:general secretion pathway protein D
LFRYENKTRSKTNLLVFLRPYVMRTTTATDRLTQDRYDFIRGQQQNFVSPNMVVRELNTPVLPPADAPTAPFVDPRYNGPVPGPVPLAPGQPSRHPPQTVPQPVQRPLSQTASGQGA